MFVYFRVFIESFNFAVNALKNNKLRTFLSLLGVTIGIFSIIAVLAAVDSLDRNIKENLSGLDKNTIYLTKFSFGPTDVPRWQRENFPQVTYEEFEFLQKNTPDADAIAYMVFGINENIKYQGKTISSVEVSAASEQVQAIEDIKVEDGRFFSEPEAKSGSPVIVLGVTLAENLFGSSNPIGKQVRVFGRKLTVIGVLQKYGNSMFGNTPDERAFVPANFVRRFMNSGKNGIPSAVTIKPKKGIDMAAFEGVLKQKLRNHRGLKYEDPDNFFVNKLSSMTDMIDNIIGMMNIAGWIIGGFSMLVGGFGIANIMFVSVKERTNLIGIQKSLGAKNKFVLFQFLFEAVILSLIGGLVGLFLVWIGTLIATSLIDDFEFILSFKNIVLGTSVAIIIGLISGIVPAWRASRLDPVEAIRTGM
ncbi:putative ABC transport system permease protein [Pustulibacterium marinum]|uniref:Putative ABC transport system permease protein n=1 Tax=Pustulibacterium marinum TaxID=1224947 RepID=A0A1I7EVA4_9FLAO|nr:ABC transporter permease [Pustulibacterium marinum]SFU27850.1 putative ABC transport system permease protein [Pustulibacterium marinum]